MVSEAMQIKNYVIDNAYVCYCNAYELEANDWTLKWLNLANVFNICFGFRSSMGDASTNFRTNNFSQYWCNTKLVSSMPQETIEKIWPVGLQSFTRGMPPSVF